MSGLLALAPAGSAYAIDQPASATVNNAAGSTIFNTDLLTGTATDADGIQSVNIAFFNAASNTIQSTPTAATVSPDGSWSLQLTKSLQTIQPNIIDPQITIQVTVTDVLANQESFSFGPYTYTIEGVTLLHNILAAVSTLSPSECAVTAALQATDTITVFGPNNEALQAIPEGELQALLTSPDELCAVLATHILVGRVESTDVTAPVQVTPANPNNQPLTVEPKDGTVVVDGSSAVVNADNNINGTSILHVINSLINPRSTVVDVDDIYTNVSSPAIHGTVSDPEFAVAIRINGQQYEATNNGDGTWTVPAGIVSLDPAASSTLFSIIARQRGVSTEGNPLGLYLVGISLRNDVLHYVQPGMGSGSTTSSSSSSVAASLVTAITNAISSDDTASAASSNSTSSEAEKPAPSPAPAASPDQQKSDADKTAKTSTNQWYWWVIGIATLGALYYILGGSPAPPAAKKK